jgi:hypothetical protein
MGDLRIGEFLGGPGGHRYDCQYERRGKTAWSGVVHVQYLYEC